MTYPEFFNNIETIKLQDNLSEFLGAFENGIMEFSYLDVVKTAGHSCPTVLGAYLMTLEALKKLYPNEIPKRGEIEVSFSQRQSEGVAGVIANVITNITGACEANGFKGIAGNYDRNYLLKFEKDIGNYSACFKRVDTQKSINVIYDASSVLPDINMRTLMQKSIQGLANNEEKIEFSRLWQKRVEDISKSIDSVIRLEN